MHLFEIIIDYVVLILGYSINFLGTSMLFLGYKIYLIWSQKSTYYTIYFIF